MGRLFPSIPSPCAYQLGQSSCLIAVRSALDSLAESPLELGNIQPYYLPPTPLVAHPPGPRSHLLAHRYGGRFLVPYSLLNGKGKCPLKSGLI